MRKCRMPLTFERSACTEPHSGYEIQPSGLGFFVAPDPKTVEWSLLSDIRTLTTNSRKRYD